MDAATRVALSNGKVTIIDAADFDREIVWHCAAGEFLFRICDYSLCDCGRSGRPRPGFNTTRNLVRLHVYLHRLVAGALPGQVVDHRNFDTLDNRRANLRIVNWQESVVHRRPLSGHTSGFRGVHWDRHIERWRAQTSLNGKRRHIGVFATEEEAARAYDTAAVGLFGNFAQLNFPSGISR